VLDALIEDRRTLVFENFSNRKIVREREVYFAPQFIISGELIEIGGIDERRRQLLARLRSVFARPYASVLITSEGGGGKTSLACWIGRNGLQARTPATIAARQRLVSISSRRGPSGFEVEGLSRAATRQTLARGHRGCPQPTYSDRSGNGFCQ